MRIPRWLEFIRTAGLLGGGSVLLAVVLFAIGIWEHYKEKNVPSMWLVATGVCSFAYGLYQAWAKERDAKEVALSQIESPEFDFQLGPTIVKFHEESNQTLFFLIGRILNKGHKSITMGWSAVYRIGQSSEDLMSFYIRTPFSLLIDGEELLVTNSDLLNVKTSENPIDRGCVANGRLLFALAGDRRRQLESLQYSIEVSCHDYRSRLYKALYTPDPKPLVGLVTHAHEIARRPVTPSQELSKKICA